MEVKTSYSSYYAAFFSTSNEVTYQLPVATCPMSIFFQAFGCVAKRIRKEMVN